MNYTSFNSGENIMDQFDNAMYKKELKRRVLKRLRRESMPSFIVNRKKLCYKDYNRLNRNEMSKNLISQIN